MTTITPTPLPLDSGRPAAVQTPDTGRPAGVHPPLDTGRPAGVHPPLPSRPAEPAFPGTTPLPQLRPLETRLSFHQFAPAGAQRFVDVLATGMGTGGDNFAGVDQALAAAKALSTTRSQPVAVLHFRSDDGQEQWSLHNAAVTASGWVAESTMGKLATQRGSVDTMATETLADALKFTSGAWSRIGVLGEGDVSMVLSVAALVDGQSVIDATGSVANPGRPAKQVAWTSVDPS